MKRLGFALALSVAVAAAVTGSAASLGGITSSLGADAAVVGSCDADGVRADYLLTFTGAAGFTVGRVIVSGIDPACVGERLDVVLTRGGASLAQGTATVSAASQDVSMVGTAPARDVDGIHVAIN